MGVGSYIFNFFFGVGEEPGDDGLFAYVSWRIMRLSVIFYAVFGLFDIEMLYIYGYNFFLWTGIGAFLVLGILTEINEEEPKKDISVLDKEINEMKSKLGELEKEKAKEVPDYSEYNKKIDEQPPVM